MKTTLPIHRGMDRWREKQRALPVGEKIELIGRFIQETRQLEVLKKPCKPSAMSSNSSSKKDR
jgi:hypothetical protein